MDEILKECYIEAVTNILSPDEFVQLYKDAVGDYKDAQEPFNPDPIVADYYEIKPTDLKRKTRKREIVEPRQICMWLREKYTRESLSEIGRRYGGKDHATVLYSKKVIDNLKETDIEFRERLETIEKIISYERTKMQLRKNNSTAKKLNHSEQTVS